ncbi:hypothetical protein FM105_12970 [Brevibacterium yomogidense]|uniref:Uncharacterized protein n=1 Tax=Brevibacterium yomogidense TaxID=946573 RepID=A0A1X6XNI5_9MICO|nr:hypothetical protein FM105_12970 [Brevibacterium yomogidense]
MGRSLHCGTTDVDPHLAVTDGLEGDQISGGSAVQSYHVRKCTERTAHGACLACTHQRRERFPTDPGAPSVRNLHHSR